MFDQLTGNELVKQLFRRMLGSGRVPGALLFTGEEGVGKKLFAVEIARALNCRAPQGVEGCGKCPGCVRMSRFNFPQSEDSDDWKKIIWTDHGDVGMVVAPKRVLLVDQMRYIEGEANFRPFEGKARVFIVDDADKLNDASANALLKTLEEPPPTSHIILITSRPAMLLPTIRSRCQAIRFSPLTTAEIEQHLLTNKLATPVEAGLRARAGNGSIGRALAGDLERFKERRDAMLQVLTALAITGDHLRLLRLAEEMNEAKHKDEYEFGLELLETLIRDALMVSLGVSSGQVINEDVLPQLQKISERIDSRSATSWISLIEELREQLVVNVNRKPATDALFLSMAVS
ncbi:MAG: DNA polymerase III subunit delta' [Pyrinomonadaceae bacterium]|jgi:DNA polymerase-3 subunit delta'|nr:DNA polymerase III subunit delta' [Pyrinomonadaceae bacterium]